VQRLRLGFIIALIGLGSTSGCALYVRTSDGDRIRTTSPAFNDYAGQVFRLHNEATTNLAYALDEIEFSEDSDEAFDTLIEADDRMLQACTAVDQVAVSRRDGKPVSLRQLNEAAKFIPECERATLDANKLIAAVEAN